MTIGSTLTLGSGSITDSGGLIDFGSTGLTTTGGITFGQKFVMPTSDNKTIAAGVISIDRTYNFVDTEAAAASDFLDTINGGVTGTWLVLRALDSTHTVILRDGVGNLRLQRDMYLDHTEDFIWLYFDGLTWIEMGRADNDGGTDVTVSRLLYLNASNNYESVTNLASWIAGTANQITVTDDTDGTVTLSLPQNIHTAASPTFAGLTLDGTYDYLFGFDNQNFCYLRNTTAGQQFQSRLYAQDGDGTDNVLLQIRGVGRPDSITDFEQLSVGYVGNVTPASRFMQVKSVKGGAGTAHPLILWTEANTNQLYLDTGGNVGINTALPTYKLDVNGTFRVVDAVVLNSSLYCSGVATFVNGLLSTGLAAIGAYITVSSDFSISAGINLILATTTGTKVGTASTQLLGFYGATPVDQPAAVVDADGTLADATTKINTIIDRLQELGLIA